MSAAVLVFALLNVDEANYSVWLQNKDQLVAEGATLPSELVRLEAPYDKEQIKRAVTEIAGKDPKVLAFS